MKSVLGVLGASSKHSTLTSGVDTACDDRDDVNEQHQQQPRELLSDGEYQQDDDEFIKIPDNLNEAEMETVLQQLTGDAQLHKLLADERMRCETHKINYSKLKAEFIRITHENQVLHAELAQAELARAESHDAVNMLDAQAQSDIQKLTQQLEAAQVLVPTEAERIELENKIAAENEAKWKMKVQHFMEELEASKLSVQNLLQENLCLKSNILHTDEETKRILEETIRKADTQILALEKQVLVAKDSHRPKVESLEAELATLAKVNTKLHSKVKFLESHLEENFAAERQREIQSVQSAAEQSKNEAFLAASIKRLEAEKSELESSLRKSRNESSNLRLKVQELGSELRDSQTTIRALKAREEERQDNFDNTINAMKKNITEEKAKLQCELDTYKKRLKDSESQFLQSSIASESTKQQMEQVKRQCQEEVNQVRAEEARKSGELHVRLTELGAANRSLQIQLEEQSLELRWRASSQVPVSEIKALEQELQSRLEQVETLQKANQDIRSAHKGCLEKLEEMSNQQHILELQLTDAKKARLTGVSKSTSDIGVQAHLLDQQAQSSEIDRLRRHIQDLQSKQRVFAELLENAPDTSSARI